MRVFHQLVYKHRWLTFLHHHIQLRRVNTVRQAGEHLPGRTLIPGQYLQQAGARIQGIIETIPAFLDKDVAAHLTCQQCAGFLDLGLDKRMTGLPHQRLAAVFADNRIEIARTLHIVNDLATRIALENIHGVQHQYTVRPDNITGGGNHPETITVTVKGQANIGLVCSHGINQVLQVFRLARVRVMVREVPIHLTEQLGHAATKLVQQFRYNPAGNPVTAIDHHLERPGNTDIFANAFDIVGHNIQCIHPALAGNKIPGLDTLA